jgi:hypothetical protein
MLLVDGERRDRAECARFGVNLRILLSYDLLAICASRNGRAEASEDLCAYSRTDDYRVGVTIAALVAMTAAAGV